MPPKTDATTQPCTLENYCQAKQLSAARLAENGVRDQTYQKNPAIRIPYYGTDGTEIAVRYRVSLKDEPKFKWKSGAKTTLYGLQHLAKIRATNQFLFVEGESDCHTAWEHGRLALGIPGASIWKEDWNTYLAGIETIYVFIENDKGGETILNHLEDVPFKEHVRLVFCEDDWKDLSELHSQDPARFDERLDAALQMAVTWQEYELAKAKALAKESWEKCQDLAQEENILDSLAVTLEQTGVVGVTVVAKIIFLALTSRLLSRPVSIAVKAVSSAGKSFVVEMVLRFFPDASYYALSAMSERALAYSKEPLKHRFLVIFEAAGMEGEMANYLIRSLLSEGRVRYETVEKTKDGLMARLIEKEGPTGLLVTTTKVSLHPENETRLMSLSVPDTKEQTRNVLRALANEEQPSTDLSPWHALQQWLSVMPNEVTIPFAKPLAELIPTAGVRLRRDFTVVLNLIRAHSILHQVTRQRDTKNRIIATFTDYAAVRKLINPLLAEGLETTIPNDVRETVKAVADIKQEDQHAKITYARLAHKLNLDKSTGYRRAQKALGLGYIVNNANKGRPAELDGGDDMPTDKPILPSVRALEERCKVASDSGGIETSTHYDDGSQDNMPHFSDDPTIPPCDHSSWQPTEIDTLFKCAECGSHWKYGAADDTTDKPIEQIL